MGICIGTILQGRVSGEAIPIVGIAAPRGISLSVGGEGISRDV